jgi:hypothetical protein
MAELIINHNDIKIRIEGESEHFFAQDLHTKAVVALIEQADVHRWEKHNQEHGSNEDALGEFCAAILVTVTRLYADEANLPSDEQTELPSIGQVSIPQSKPVHDILPDIIKHLRDSGYLKNEIISSSGLRAEEPEDFN